MTSNCHNQADCKTLLTQLIAAYNKLISGDSVQEVEMHDGERTKYFKGDIKLLKQQIQTLHEQCGNELSAAIVGQRGRRHARGVCYWESPGRGGDRGCS